MITVQDHRRPESRAKHEIYNAFGFATATGGGLGSNSEYDREEEYRGNFARF